MNYCDMNEKEFDKQVDRNLKGKALEKVGKVDDAIELYEKNIAGECEGNFPYDRLAIIYRKRGMLDEEIRVLNKAIEVFKNLSRMDVPPKLEQFESRLLKAKKLKKKSIT